MSTNNLSFYYLYKYGTPSGSGYSSLNANDGSFQTNNFVGSYLQYNRFDLTNSMDFVTKNTEDSTSDDNYTDFYSKYKSIVGSDVMSYVNKYANTDSMALGDMVNTKDGSTSYIDNLTADTDTFAFHATKDGDPYRYTSNGSAEALLNIDSTAGADFNDLSKAYQEYSTYITAKLNGDTTATLTGNPAVDLSTLGINYTTILAKVGNNADTAKAVYQNLINQFVSEAKSIKAGTLSSDNLATMDRDLDDKQRGLKSIDDDLFGYVEKAAPVTVTTDHYTLSFNFADAANKTVLDNAIAGVDATYKGTTNKDELLKYLDAVIDTNSNDSGLRTDYVSAVKAKITRFVADNPAYIAVPPAKITRTNVVAIAGSIDTNSDTTVNDYVASPTANLAGCTTLQNYIDAVDTDNTDKGLGLSNAQVNNIGNRLYIDANKSNFSTQGTTTSWVNSHYGSLDADDKADLSSYLYQKNRFASEADRTTARNNYIDALATALTTTSAFNVNTATMPNLPTTQTITQNDITTRKLDSNYSDNPGTAYLKGGQLGSLIQGIVNGTRSNGRDVDPGWIWDDIYYSDNYAVPAENVYTTFSNLGINITDATGANVQENGTDGHSSDGKYSSMGTSDTALICSGGTSLAVNGIINLGAFLGFGDTIHGNPYGAYSGNNKQEIMYDWLNNNPSALQDKGDGLFSFNYPGTSGVSPSDAGTYYINTKTQVDLGSSIKSQITSKTNAQGGRVSNVDINGLIGDTYNAGYFTGGVGTLEMRHLKVTDPSKGAVLALSGDPNAVTVVSNTIDHNAGNSTSDFSMGTDTDDYGYVGDDYVQTGSHSSTTSISSHDNNDGTQTVVYQYNLSNFPYTADGYIFHKQEELDDYNKVKNGTAIVGTTVTAWTNPIVTQIQTWDPTYTDASGNQVGAWTSGPETFSGQKEVSIKSNVQLNTDSNSLVYQLAESLVTSTDIVASANNNVTPKQKQEFAIYLSEVSASIMEQYWIENYNKADAEPIDKYFAREFQAYLNASSTSANKDFNFVDSDNKIAHFAINFDEDPSKTNIVDKILEKQSWAQMYTKMEDRSRTEMSLFEESASMDTVANINNKEYEYRMGLLEAMQKDADTNHITKDLDFSGVNKNLVTEGAGEEKNPWWSSYFPWFKGTYGNLPDGATPADMFDSTGHLTAAYGSNVDPYLVKINNVDYVMGKDDNEDGEITNAQEILGITDTKDTSFTSLKALDTNKDGFISQDELKAQHIIFKAMNSSDRMNGSSISSDFIRGIDLSTLEKGDGTNNIYGLFNVQLTNGQKAAAVQTFESQSYFNNLFGDYADMSFLNKTTPVTTSTTTTAATATTAATTKTTDTTNTTSTDSATKELLLGKKFNFFTYLNNTTDDSTTTDTLTNTDDSIVVNDKEVSLSSLIDEYCWKFDVNNLTAKQKYSILDSVDTSNSSDVIVKKIEDQVNKLHTEFSA